MDWVIKMKNIIVCGGDERNYWLCRALAQEGYKVSWLFAEKYPSDGNFTDNESGDIPLAYAVILPLPLSRDGQTLNAPLSDRKIYLRNLDLSGKCKFVFTSDNRISGINYFENEAVTIDNARLTAVGFLKELLGYEKEDIIGKNALVTGFGRVSKATCDILSRNGVRVTAAARNENQRHEARARGYNALTISQAEKKLNAYDYVINTVPEKLFEEQFIKKADENTAFFELAAGLVDKAKCIPRAYIECKGMPGKHTPKAAGRVIARFVCDRLRE